MKKMIRRCAAGVLAAAALTTAASAADFTACADRLYEMKLFYGTDQGYDLDRTPSRAEASAMLVRLLGKEEEARTGNYTSPFTDVPAWAKPYVGWLYQNKLTFGVGGNKFGSNDSCDAQMMAAFLLRTLGYAEANGDLTYQTALEFAEEKGVADSVNQGTEDFTRDEMVAMSYTALSRPTKAGASSLLSALVAEGAVDRTAAADTLALFTDYRTYENTMNASAAQARETETSTVLRAGSETVTLYTFASVDPQSQTFASQTLEGQSTVSALYYADGTLTSLQAGEQTSAQISFDEALGESLLPISVVRDTVAVGGTVTLIAEPAPATRWLDGQGAVQSMSLSVTAEGGELSEQALYVNLTAAGQTLEAEYHTVTTATGYDVWVVKPSVIR
ncbi:MAG: hypothetical protein ACI4PD_01510 [Butyricicoccus sp.]